MNATIKEEFTRVQRLSDNKYNLITEDFYGKIYRSQEYEFYLSKGESWGICTATKLNGNK